MERADENKKVKTPRGPDFRGDRKSLNPGAGKDSIPFSRAFALENNLFVADWHVYGENNQLSVTARTNDECLKELFGTIQYL